MHRIQAVCLGHKEKFIANYESIKQLETAVHARFSVYLNKKNIQQISVKFIITYKDQNDGTEKLLKNMNVINEKRGAWFYVAVKRVCMIIII